MVLSFSFIDVHGPGSVSPYDICWCMGGKIFFKPPRPNTVEQGVVVKISKQVAALSTGFKARDGLVSPLRKTMGGRAYYKVLKKCNIDLNLGHKLKNGRNIQEVGIWLIPLLKVCTQKNMQFFGFRCCWFVSSLLQCLASPQKPCFKLSFPVSSLPSGLCSVLPEKLP